jgi:LPS export ABC transporter protein LptC
MKLLTIAFLVLAFYSSCTDRTQVNNEGWKALDTLQITETIYDSEITYTDSGYLRAKLYADLIERHSNDKKPYVELRKGLKANFYNTAKEIESELTAGYGINYLDSRIVEVQKQVIVVNSKGEQLETEKLFWDQNEKTIYTDAQVKITTETEELYGNGMTAAQDFSSWKITKVTGVVTLKN